ncbi:hypothetical protein [uncultured Corynebacterium sp.]|uniref:hypothetical protein n=1 Tax=uncultured Corynebacterium sp. TaxID=159447 RepID=UPI0025F3BE0C|nr:hypothetical protein [uncultured Corynebacterium sp.]
MEAVKVRTGTRALVTSKAMMTCVLFVLICAPFLFYFTIEWMEAQGPMRTLFAIAAAAPACGMAAALGSMLVVWSRRRKAVLVVGDTVMIPRTGISFPTADLTTVQVWSDRSPRSYVALLPGHVRERANTTGVQSIQPYVVAFPRGADPQPFEFAEMLLQRKSDITVDRLGAL